MSSLAFTLDSSGSVTGMVETVPSNPANIVAANSPNSQRYSCGIGADGKTLALNRSTFAVSNMLSITITLYTFEAITGVAVTTTAPLDVCAYDLTSNPAPMQATLPDGAMYSFPAWSSISGTASPNNPPPFLVPVSTTAGTFYRYYVLLDSTTATVAVQDLYPPNVVSTSTLINTTGKPVTVKYSTGVTNATGSGSTNQAFAVTLPSSPSPPLSSSTLMLPRIQASAVVSTPAPVVITVGSTDYTLPVYAYASASGSPGGYNVPLPSPLSLADMVGSSPTPRPNALVPLTVTQAQAAASTSTLFYCATLGEVYTLTAEPVVPTSTFVLTNTLQRYSVQAVFNDPFLPCENSANGNGVGGTTGGPAQTTALTVTPSNNGSAPLRHGATVSFYLFYEYMSASGGVDTAANTTTGMLGVSDPAAVPASAWDWSTAALACVSAVVDMSTGTFVVPKVVANVNTGTATTMLPSLTLAINGFQYSVGITGTVGDPAAGRVTFTVSPTPRKSYNNLTSNTRAVHNELCIPVEIAVGSGSTWLPVAPFQSESIACANTDSLYVRSIDGAYGLTFDPTSGSTTELGEDVVTASTLTNAQGNTNFEYVITAIEPLGLTSSASGSPSPLAVGLNVVNVSTTEASITFSPDVTVVLLGQPLPLLSGPTGGVSTTATATPPAFSFSAWVASKSFNTVASVTVGLTDAFTYAGATYTLLQLLQDPAAGLSAGLSCVCSSGSTYPKSAGDATPWPVLPPSPVMFNTNTNTNNNIPAAWTAFIGQHPMFTLYVLDPVKYLLFSTPPSTSSSLSSFTATVVFTPNVAGSEGAVTQTLTPATPTLPAQASSDPKDTVTISVNYGIGTGTTGTGTGTPFSPPPLTCAVSDLFAPGYTSPSPAYSIVPSIPSASATSARLLVPAQAAISVNPVTVFVFAFSSPSDGVSLTITLGAGVSRTPPQVLDGKNKNAAATFYAYGDLSTPSTQRQGFNFAYTSPGQPVCTLTDVDASTLYTAAANTLYISDALPFLAVTSAAAADPTSGLVTVQLGVLGAPCGTDSPCVCTSVDYTPAGGGSNAPTPSAGPSSGPSSGPSTGPSAGPSASVGPSAGPSAEKVSSSSGLSQHVITIIIVCVLGSLALAAAFAGIYFLKSKKK